ncbi:MAG: methyltransferase domain-containing protein [Candidatus Sulfotelmatobacter sp.]
MIPLATQKGQSDPPNDKAKGFFARSPEVACVSVQEGYERWAENYDQTPNPLLALEERYLRKVLSDVAGSSVLDLGCGTGRWLTGLLARGAGPVVGIDLSAAMLKVAGGTVGIRNRLVLADGLQLPFRASAFDFVLSSFVLNHIQHLDSMARELARTMKWRGRLLICEMHPEAYARGWRPGFRDQRSAVRIDTVSHSTESIVSRFRAHGFTCVELCNLFFGESEQAIFLGAGKGDTFKAACDVPAIQVYQFTNMASETSS